MDAYYELYPENKDEILYIFFDEIQEVPFWETFLRRLYDQENVEICFTGSSSKLLNKEIATGLRGRTLTYRIFSYSFKEFLNVKGVTLQRNFEYTPLRHKIKNLLLEYIELGGFPEIADKDKPLKTKILQEYFDLIFYKYLVDRYQIRSFATVKEMLLYLVITLLLIFQQTSIIISLSPRVKRLAKIRYSNI